MSLEELIYNCKKNNRKAQEHLYTTYAPVLYGICLKYTKNKAEAEDILHDSFMTIYSKIEQYKSKGSFEGWLKRITINTALQKFRKKEYLSTVTENTEEAIEIETENTEVELQLLLAYIQELPTKYQTTFNLYVLDGYTHKEISEQLGTTVGTSKSNLARARAILKEKLETKITQSLISILIFGFQDI